MGAMVCILMEAAKVVLHHVPQRELLYCKPQYWGYSNCTLPYILISLHLVQVGGLVKTCVTMVTRDMLGRGVILYWTEVRMVWDHMEGLYSILSEVCTLHMHVNQPCVLGISSARMSAC
jgi:hypothetical protein